MPRQQRASTPSSDNCPVPPQEPEERYSEILNNFNSFDRKSNPITPRKAHGRSSRTDKSQVMTPRPLGLTKNPRSNCERESKKSVRSKSTTVTGSLTTDPEDSPVPQGGESPESANKRLEHENRRLKRLLRAKERQSSKDGTAKHKIHKDSRSESDVIKLTEKAKALKLQFKDERRKSMQMNKNLEAHHVEIEGLQRELAKALDTVDNLEKDQAIDRAQLLKLTNEVEEWRKKDAKTPVVKRLEATLMERNDELEMTLEMLETKVERIVLLENELRATKRRLHEMHQMDIEQTSTSQGSESSMDLHETRAECRRLKRQNMMLRLLFEELEESRTVDEVESIDSLFQKIASELGSPVPSTGTGLDEDGHGGNFPSQAAGDDFPSPDCSPVGNCPSIPDDPSTDASSARAEALFQKEIERFHSLQDSSSSFPKGRKISPRSPRDYVKDDDDWINPYDL